MSRERSTSLSGRSGPAPRHHLDGSLSDGGERVVHVSNANPEVQRRSARLTLDEICVDITATGLSVEETIAFAFSLE